MNRGLTKIFQRNTMAV